MKAIRILPSLTDTKGWAVWRPNRSRPTRVFESKPEAEVFARKMAEKTGFNVYYYYKGA